MRTYLNSSQKNQISFTSALLAMLTEFDNNDTLSKPEKTAMKYVITWLTKLLKSLFERMPDVAERVKRDLKDNRVMLSPRFSKMNEREYVETSDLIDLLEMLVEEHCVGCLRCDFGECAVFKTHQQLQIDVEGGEPEGRCPYGYALGELIRENKGGNE